MNTTTIVAIILALVTWDGEQTSPSFLPTLPRLPSTLLFSFPL